MINDMAENSEDCNIKNHISSLDCQFLAEDQSKLEYQIRLDGEHHR